LAFALKYRRDKKQRASHSQQMLERPAQPKNPFVILYSDFREREHPLPQDY
jgi:hypothetical protein